MMPHKFSLRAIADRSCLGGQSGHRVCLLCATLLAICGILVAPQANATSPNICDVVADALPSVVNIQNAGLVRQSGQATIQYSVGTGTIIDPSGSIVTNQHVIQNAMAIRIKFRDKTQVPARLVPAVSLVNVALFIWEASRPLPAIAFGDSDALKVGQPAIAVGNPIGVGTSVSTGSVSVVSRNLMWTPFDDYIQTDASINPGNSHGPLIDCNGNVIRINTSLLSNDTASEPIELGFSLPSNGVAYVVKAPQDSRIVPTWIGRHAEDMDARLARLFQQPKVSGAFVTGTEPGGPAAQAQLMTSKPARNGPFRGSDAPIPGRVFLVVPRGNSNPSRLG